MNLMAVYIRGHCAPLASTDCCITLKATDCAFEFKQGWSWTQHRLELSQTGPMDQGMKL